MEQILGDDPPPKRVKTASTVTNEVKYSCVACRDRKVRCDKKFPCGNCVKHGIDCIPQMRKRGRPPRPELHQRPAIDQEDHIFQSTFERPKNELVAFIQQIPKEALNQGFLDVVKQHILRTLCKTEALGRKDQNKCREHEPPWIDAGFEGWGTVAAKYTYLLQQCIADLGVPDLKEFAGEVRTYADVEAEFKRAPPTLPDHMQPIVNKSSFPDAAVCIEHQLNGYTFYETNDLFASLFASAPELDSCLYGLRNIIHPDDRTEFMWSALQRSITRTQQGSDDCPQTFHSVMRIIARRNEEQLCYVRRFSWYEKGGQRSCSVVVLYPLPAESKYLKPQTDRLESNQSQIQIIQPSKKGSYKAAQVAVMPLISTTCGADQHPKASEDPVENLLDVDENNIESLINEKSSVDDMIKDFYTPLFR